MPAERDVLIIGAGPAGLAAAIAARQLGLSVLILEGRREGPLDRACGEGLMPDGLAVLAELGVDTLGLRGLPFRGIRYLEGDLVAEGRFPGLAGLGVRRTELHRALLARAVEVGVEVRWGVRATGLANEGVATAHGELSARFVVGADGLNSRVRAWAGFRGPSETPAAKRRFGVRQHYRIAPWTDCVEVYWGDGCEAYVTPVAPDEVGVAILWSGGPARFDTLLVHFPRLVRELGAAPAASKPRGAGPLLQRPWRVASDLRVALVGDASGYLDAITGEGLSMAFHQAKALAQAMAVDCLDIYENDHAKIGRLPNTMTRLLLAVERRPWLRHRLIQTLAADPELFSRLLGVHARALPLRGVGLGGMVRLVWGLAGG